MKQLIHAYAITLLIVITMFAIVVSFVTTKQNDENVGLQMNQISKDIPITMDDYNSNLRRMVFALFENQEAIDSMHDYMYMDYAAYFKQQMSLLNPQFFQKDVSNMYDNYDGIEGILITLQETGDIYYSNQNNKMGVKLDQLPDLTGKLIFNRNLPNYEAAKSSGTIYLIFNYDNLDRLIDSIAFQVNTSVFVVSEHGKLKYSYNSGDGDELEREIIAGYEKIGTPNINAKNTYKLQETELVDGSILYVAVARSTLFISSFKTYSWVIIASIILDGILLIVLFRTFGRYDKQLNDMLLSMERIQGGDIDYRISTLDKNNELLTISEGINITLDSINEYIDQIYKLEISQQEVNLRALQSQINPHLLYNTLEFIRMYAVIEGVDELAEIVYTFSGLLRNNISLEKTTSLQKELEFCEKYVYLHQMRYPNRIAYKFDIDENLALTTIPKFTLQPLIENYFVHGVDYASVQNAISVSAHEENGRIFIKVSDNGRGIDDAQLQELQSKVDDSVFDVSHNNSVGLLNVHQRLKMYLKERDYTMELCHSSSGGFSVIISFMQEEEHDKSNIS